MEKTPAKKTAQLDFPLKIKEECPNYYFSDEPQNAKRNITKVLLWNFDALNLLFKMICFSYEWKIIYAYNSFKQILINYYVFFTMTCKI